MNKQILLNIYDDITEISSKELQEEIWLGNNPNKSSSYTELMCSLFDDNKFNSFLKLFVYDVGFLDISV